MAKVKVSVITPLYNSANYIDEFVQKFLKQTLDEVELILVDDASPDEGYEIAKKYELNNPDKIRVFTYEVNRRAGGARNCGLNFARGDFVCFVDPDDWMDDTMLYKLYYKAIDDGCDIVDCDYYEYDEMTKEFNPKVSYIDNCIGIVTNELLNNTIVYGGRIFTKIFDRKMLIDNEIFYPENIRFEDNGVIHQLCSKKIGKVKENLFYYRTNSVTSQNGSIKNNDYIKDRISAAINMVDFVKSKNKFNDLFYSVEYRFLNIGYASSLFKYVANDFPINFDELKRAYGVVCKYFNNYKTNKYYKKNIRKIYKILMYSYELCPNLLRLYKCIGRIFFKIFSIHE